MDIDLKNLKHKVEQGADFVTTQLFDNSDYFNFEKRLREMGIDAPIVAGILPLFRRSVKRFCAMCGSSIPEDLSRN